MISSIHHWFRGLRMDNITNFRRRCVILSAFTLLLTLVIGCHLQHETGQYLSETSPPIIGIFTQESHAQMFNNCMSRGFHRYTLIELYEDELSLADVLGHRQTDDTASLVYAIVDEPVLHLLPLFIDTNVPTAMLSLTHPFSALAHMSDRWISLNPRVHEEAEALSKLIVASNTKELVVLVQSTLYTDGLYESLSQSLLRHGASVPVSLKLFNSASLVKTLRSLLTTERGRHEYGMILLHCERELSEEILNLSEVLYYNRKIIWLLSGSASFNGRIVHNSVSSEYTIASANVVTLVPTISRSFVEKTLELSLMWAEMKVREENYHTHNAQRYYEYEMWLSSPGQTEWKKLSNFSSETRLGQIPDLTKLSNTQRRNLYRIVTVEEEPFVYIEEPISDGKATYCRAMSLPCLSVEAVLQSNLTNDILNKIIIDYHHGSKDASRPYDLKCCSGLCIDLLLRLASELDFDFELYLSPDGQFGAYDVHEERWTGLMHELLQGRADIALASFSVLYARGQVIDFSSPYYQSGVSMLANISAHLSSNSGGYFSFLKPFAGDLWATILISTFIAAVTLAVVEWFSPSGMNPPHDLAHADFTFGSAVKTVVSLLCGNIIPCKVPRAWPAKWVQNIWGCFCIIYLAEYTANLTSSLTENDAGLKINGIHDPQLLGLRVAALRNAATESFVSNINPKLYKEMRKYNISSRQEALDMIKAGKLDIMLGDTAAIDYIVKRKNPNSSLANVNTISEGSFSLGFAKNSKSRQLRGEVSERMLEYWDSGFIDRLATIWLRGYNNIRPADKVSSQNNGAGVQLQFPDISGLFISLGSIVVLCFGLLGLEQLIFQKLIVIVKRKSEKSLWKSKLILFISQRFYRSTHGERKDSEGLMQEIVKKMSKAKVFLTEINQKLIARDEVFTWTFYDVVQQAYQQKFHRTFEHLQFPPTYPAKHRHTLIRKAASDVGFSQSPQASPELRKEADHRRRQVKFTWSTKLRDMSMRSRRLLAKKVKKSRVQETEPTHFEVETQQTPTTSTRKAADVKQRSTLMNSWIQMQELSPQCSGAYDNKVFLDVPQTGQKRSRRPNSIGSCATQVPSLSPPLMRSVSCAGCQQGHNQHRQERGAGNSMYTEHKNDLLAAKPADKTYKHSGVRRLAKHSIEIVRVMTDYNSDSKSTQTNSEDCELYCRSCLLHQSRHQSQQEAARLDDVQVILLEQGTTLDGLGGESDLVSEEDDESFVAGDLDEPGEYSASGNHAADNSL